MSEGGTNGRRICRDALFSSGTQDYCCPMEADAGDEVTLRLRTMKGEGARVCYVEKGIEKEMVLASSDTLFDYYEYRRVLGEDPVRYHYKIEKNGECVRYNRLGCVETAEPTCDFVITPGFSTPDWAKGARMYQIFVDRFCNGDPQNDVADFEYVYIGTPVRRVKDWYEYPEKLDVGRFYGGDLKGIEDKLDYLESLKVEVIYLNPVFVSPSNHKYDCQDYEHVDPHYGKIVHDEEGAVGCDERDNAHSGRYMVRTADPANLAASDALFGRLVAEIHKRGMRVILDGVFNHCGSFNKWLDAERIYERFGGYAPGAFVAKDSPYHAFFSFRDSADNAWPSNKSYEGWWGHETLPKLNYEGSEELVRYILDIARKWLQPPFDADGWRLDVAADLGHTGAFNHRFWKLFRKAVKEAKPDALILAEHYGDPSDWLSGDEWDSVMNYDAFMEPVTWFLTGMEKHSDSFNEGLWGDGEVFFRNMIRSMGRMQMPSLLCAMNELSNHDHSRFLTRTNQKVGRIASCGPEQAGEGVKLSVLRLAVLIQFTWPGAPTIYYGDEAGVAGWTDPDSRRPYPWGRENLELIEYHRYLAAVHEKIPVFRTGAIKPLFWARHQIAYGRMNGKYHAVIIVNNKPQEELVSVPVWQLGITDDMPLGRAMLTQEAGYNVGFVLRHVENGFLKIKMHARSAVIYVSHPEEFYPVPGQA